MYTDTPKTASSARSTKISPALVELLHRYKVEQARARLERGDLWSPEWDSAPRLFTNQNGTPMQPSTPEKRLGHSQTSTTMNIYAETIRSAEAAAAQVLDDVLMKKA